MGSIRPLPGGLVPASSGRLPGGSSIRSIESETSANLLFHGGIASNGCEETGAGNTVSGSTINIGFVSDGRLAMPTKLKSRTIIKRRTMAERQGHSKELVGRRLPRHRPPTRPGEMLLEEFVKPLAITQSELASRLGISFPRLNEIIRGKRAITSDTALRLARVLGMSADFWLGLQLDWDLWHAMRSSKATEIDRLEPLRTSA
jgi:antitoxin HigA-1